MADVRFEDVESTVEAEVALVVSEGFPDLINAKIKVLYDTKKRVTGDKIVLGRMMKSNDLLRHMTYEESKSDEGFDYFLFLDKMAYRNIDPADRVRLVRHELQHCDVDFETEKNPYGLRTHEIEDFYEEVAKNATEPEWRDRVALVAESLYDEEAEREKDSKKAKRNSPAEFAE